MSWFLTNDLKRTSFCEIILSNGCSHWCQDQFSPTVNIVNCADAKHRLQIYGALPHVLDQEFLIIRRNTK